MPLKLEKKTAKHEVRVHLAQRFEIRSNSDGSRSISGYAVVWNSLSEDLGGFRETIKPGAFTQSLKDSPDVLAYYSHDSSLILGRVSSGTLTVTEDSIGLHFTCKLPDTSTARDLIALMERGDVSQMSFGFSIPQGGDEWAEVNGQVIRTVIRAVLYEVSVVGQPAYSATSVNLRSCPSELRTKLKRNDDDYDDNDDNDDLDCDGEDADDPDCEESEDERCAYRCAACRSAELVHLSNIAEDDPSARSKRSVTTSLSEDDLMQEQERCAYRCAACRSLLSGHFPVPNAADESTRAAHAALLLRRLR
jgi:Escherichia/Staphylococcus phage prohead protease